MNVFIVFVVINVLSSACATFCVTSSVCATWSFRWLNAQFTRSAISVSRPFSRPFFSAESCHRFVRRLKCGDCLFFPLSSTVREWLIPQPETDDYIHKSLVRWLISYISYNSSTFSCPFLCLPETFFYISFSFSFSDFSSPLISRFFPSMILISMYVLTLGPLYKCVYTFSPLPPGPFPFPI